MASELLFVGIKGHVVALEAYDGTERWRTKLVGNDFVSVASDGDRLYAAARGEVFCLDRTTGTVLWRNGMKGLGWGLASLLPPGALTTGGETLARAQQRAEAQRRAAAAHGAT